MASGRLNSGSQTKQFMGININIRLCVNYKKLNDVIVNDPMPMPEIDDILSKIGQSDMFSTVDMSRGYYAIAMTDREKDCRIVEF